VGAVASRVVDQEVEVKSTVAVGEKDVLAIIAALGHVMGDLWLEEARSAGHIVL
jgi:hypothetical protein